jgi:AmmeMemoRadiSam system protein A
MFNHEEQQTLLHVARRAIMRELGLECTEEPLHLTEALTKPAGAFVTLLHGEELRGCIGYVEAMQSVLSVVEEVAKKSAFEDHRFPPLQASECAEIVIEISVLSPLQLIKSVDEIQVGKHGLLLETHYARGLLLPQVAVEHGWDRLQFLEHTARKAGLPISSLRDPSMRISVFEADVFAEHPVLESDTHGT